MAQEKRMDIVKRIVSWGGWVWRFKMLLGAVMTGGILVWMASATEWMNQFAPFSWGVAFLFGVLAVVWICAGGAKFYLWCSEAKYNIVRSEEPSSINPLEDVFQKQTIKIEDFRPPILKPIKEQKSFINCTLLGPCVLFFKKPNIQNCEFIGCDFMRVPDRSVFVNVICFDSITIMGGMMTNATILVPEPVVSAVENGIPGIRWSNVTQNI